MRHIALTGLAGLLMTGCTSEAEQKKLETMPCPRVGILNDTEKLTVYDGAGRDLTDVVLRAEIEQAATTCEYDLDDGIIYVDVGFRGVAELGPAAGSRNMSVPTFIALTETDNRVLRKEIRPLNLSFGGTSRRVSFVQTIEETKVPYVPPFDGAAYEMLVGFQLSGEQLERNRAGKTGGR